MKHRIVGRLVVSTMLALAAVAVATPSVLGVTVSRQIQNSAARDIAAIKTGLNTIARIERDGVRSILSANSTTLRILQRAQNSGLTESEIQAIADKIKRTISGKRLTAQTKLNAFVNAQVPRIERIERNAAIVTSGYVAFIRDAFGTSDGLVELLNARFNDALTALFTAESLALAEVDAALDMVLP